MYYNTKNYGYGYNTSYARILHASPDAPGVDVYLNNTLIAQNLTYENFTEYLPLMNGRYNVQVFATGTRSNPVIDTVINIMPNSDYTIAATGFLNDIQPLVINDTSYTIPPNMSQVKFVHLVPDAPKVDVTLSDGKKLFENIGFREVSKKILVDPGRYTLQVRIAGTDDVVLTVPNVVLNPSQYYTVYAVGTVKGNKPLQAIIALDKASY
ncbi:DUF4397 domain-containing protein [Senegalia massiliensis]|uniref:DUF4397 domain-containing protein n=1 Tax=Senegalia massiliensis TaxID=1720316 RepID=A0A845QVK9_9CLOT|nr:DUF4397 domain-containing protein [Senegalia massiliensis]NBI05829.1 DUF4397 domain-containing protein [Senegalia massiliensis]